MNAADIFVSGLTISVDTQKNVNRNEQKIVAKNVNLTEQGPTSPVGDRLQGHCAM
jgi:mannose/fructose/N-acetylgalactosamine-specific phosphotransferase system component IID